MMLRLIAPVNAALLALGVVFRFAQFFYNRPLWRDERALVLNIIERSFAELLLPLTNEQAAPPGFLLAEKIVISLFGTSTYTLRLFPLAAGLLSLFLMWRIAVRVSPIASPLILGQFALSNLMIYYSSEAKQYGLDVFFALLILWLALELNASPRRLVALVVVGVVSVFCSHPAVFVLAGVALVGLIYEPPHRRRWLMIGAVWAVAFLAAYLLFYRVSNTQNYLNEYWAEWFMKPDLFWFIKATLDTATSVAGLYSLPLVIAVLAGIIIALRACPPRIVLLVMVPLLATLAASGLQKYPFNGRLLLFLIPGLMLLAGYGLTEFIRVLTGQRRLLAAAAAAALLVVMLNRVSVQQDRQNDPPDEFIVELAP